MVYDFSEHKTVTLRSVNSKIEGEQSKFFRAVSQSPDLRAQQEAIKSSVEGRNIFFKRLLKTTIV